MSRGVFLSGLVVLVLLGAGLWAVVHRRIAPLPNPVQAVADFGKEANWVCLPGRSDSCAGNLDATAIAADGALQHISATRPADPPVDCFYVYPTVSKDPTANARLLLTDEIAFTAYVQFARFSTVCRPYAPLYRQTTLRALEASALGIGPSGDRALAYGDVRDAWQTYLARYNKGRGVVLIGHSQGSRMLKRLVQEEIEGKPAQALLLSVMLLGNSVTVPVAGGAGGDFRSIKPCTAAAQIGCVIAYSSFRAAAPPPPHSRYGNDPGAGMTLVCTNPAALAGGAALLSSYFPAHVGRRGRNWTDPPEDITTPFVTVPGLISGQCVHADGNTYLSISMNGRPGDRRLGDVGGDVIVFGHVLSDWGLHLIDVNLTQGDLVKIVQAESTAFTGAAQK